MDQLGVGTPRKAAARSRKAQTNSQEIAALQNAIRMVAETQDLSKALSFICRAIVETLGFNSSMICLVNRAKGIIEGVEGFNVPPKLIQDTVRDLNGPDILADVVIKGSIEVITGWDPRLHQETFESFKDHYGCRVFAPIVQRGEVLGVVEAGHAPGKTSVDEYQIALLRSFLDHAAVAISNARHMQKTQGQMEQLKALISVGSAISSNLNVDEIMSTVVNAVSSLMKSDNCVLRLLDGDELVLGAQAGIGSLPDLPARIPAQYGFAKLLIDSRETLAVADLTSDPRLAEWGITISPSSRMRSYLGAPLVAGGELLGVLGVYSSTPRSFIDQDIEVFTTIANQAAAAIKNARHYSDVRHQMEELRALNEVNSVISSSLDLDEIMSSVIDAAERLIGFERCMLRLKEGDWFLVGAFRGFSESEIPTERISANIGIAEILVNTREPLVISDLYTDERLNEEQREFYRHSTVRSYLGIPLIASGEVVGILGMFGVGVYHYNKREVSILTAIASQAAAAIKNARQFAEIHLQMKQLQALASVGAVASSSLNTQEIMSSVVEVTSSLMGAQMCTLRLLEGDQLVIGAHKGIPESMLSERVPSDQGLSRILLESRKPFIIPDMHDDEWLEKYQLEFTKKTSLRSYLGAPLIAAGEIVGILGFFSRRAGEFSDREVNVFMTIANQAAMAIRNARHFEEIRWQMNQLQALTSVGSTVSSSLDADQIMATVVEIASRLMDSDLCILRLVRGDQLILGAQKSNITGVQLPECVQGDCSIFREIVSSGEPYLVVDLQKCNQLDAYIRELVFGKQACLRSFIGVPMTASGNTIGILGIYKREPHSFSDSEIAVISSIANQAAVAVNNALHFKAIKTQMEQLKALTSVSSVISSSLQLKEIMSTIVEAASTLMGSEICTLRLLEGDELVIGAHKGMDENTLTERIHKTLGLAGVLVETGETLWIPDLRNDKRLDDYRLVFSDSHLRSFLGAPLIANGELVGVLGMYGREVYYFSESELEVFESIANQAAVAIANARLYEQIAQARDDLEAKVQERTRDLAETNERIGAILSGISDGITLIDHDHSIVWVNEIEASRWGGYEQLVGSQCKNSKRFSSGNCVNCPAQITLKTGQIARAILPATLPDGEIRYYDIVASPIRDAQGRVIQALEIDRDITDYRKMEEKVAEYTRKLEQMVEERTAELQRKNEELESFVFTVSHDLKAPIVSIQGFAANLAREYSPALEGDGQFYIERIRKNTEQLQSLIQELLELSRIGRLPEPWEKISVRELVEDVTAELQFQIEQHGIQLDIQSELPDVVCQRKRFRQVFVNLIDNAIHYRSRTRTPFIRISAEDLGDAWEFCVQDNGAGIAPENQRKIFQIFQRLHKVPDARDGAGVGLAIVKKIVETHGGQIRVESQGEGLGSSFIFSIPKKEDVTLEQAA